MIEVARELFSDIFLKIFLAISINITAGATLGDERIISIFVFILTLDLITGVLVSFVSGTFRMKRIHDWAKKLIMFLILVMLFSFIDYSYAIASKIEPTGKAVNWIMTLAISCEVISIVRNMRFLGLPVPIWILKTLENFKAKWSQNLNGRRTTDRQIHENDHSHGVNENREG